MYGHFHCYPFQVIGDPFYCNVFGEEGKGVEAIGLKGGGGQGCMPSCGGEGLACKACRRFPLVSLLR